MNIDARFLMRRGDFVLDARFSVPARGVTAVFGPSGAGKTTLLRAIAGLEAPDEGRLVIEDDTWQDERQFLAPHKRPVGYVFQESNLFPHLSVRRNLEYGFRRVPASERRIGFEEAVELLGIGTLLGRNPDRLSGGERQRVAIARALLTTPRLLLLDEPIAALDSKAKREILPFLERLHAKLDIPVLYVSHSADEVARLADHMVLMEAGHVLAAGPIRELLTRFDLPLALSKDAEAIIEAVVASHDDAFGLTRLDFDSGCFMVVRKDLPVGRSVRLLIHARDVSLTRERQTGTSILNIFRVTVDAVEPKDDAQVVVRLRLGEAPILAQITRKSAENLAVGPGVEFYAQIKSVALLA